MRQGFIKIIKPPDPCYNYKRPLLEQMDKSLLGSGNRILDLGSGGRRLAPGIIALDIDRQNADVVADAAHLPFKDASFKLIISTAVLEHVPDFSSAVHEIGRCCAVNGEIYIEIPFMQTYHGHPKDFRRFTLVGLEAAFSRFAKRSSGVCVGPFSTLAWYLRKLPRALAGDGLWGQFCEFCAGWLTFWIKYFDAIIPGSRRAHQVASGLFFHGVKAAK